MSRIRKATIDRIQSAFARVADAWQETGQAVSLRRYAFRHGVAHHLALGEPAEATLLLSDFAYLMVRLEEDIVDTSSSLLPDVWAVLRQNVVQPDILQALAEVLRASSHQLRRGDTEWPRSRILLQLAADQPPDHPLHRLAQTWFERQPPPWVLLRRSSFGRRSPAHVVLEGHSKRVLNAIGLTGGRIASWDVNRTIIIWDEESGQPLRTIGQLPAVIRVALETLNGCLSSLDVDSTLRTFDLNTGELVHPELRLPFYSDILSRVSPVDSSTFLVWQVHGGGHLVRVGAVATAEPLFVAGDYDTGEKATTLTGGAVLTWGRAGVIAYCSDSRDVLWRFESPGRAVKSVLEVAADLLIVLRKAKEHKSYSVSCLHAESGKTLWEIDGGAQHVIRHSPDRVLLHASGALAIINARSGVVETHLEDSFIPRWAAPLNDDSVLLLGRRQKIWHAAENTTERLFTSY